MKRKLLPLSGKEEQKMCRTYLDFITQPYHHRSKHKSKHEPKHGETRRNPYKAHRKIFDRKNQAYQASTRPSPSSPTR